MTTFKIDLEGGARPWRMHPVRFGDDSPGFMSAVLQVDAEENYHLQPWHVTLTDGTQAVLVSRRFKKLLPKV